MEQDTLKAIYQVRAELEQEQIALKEFKADFNDQLSELDGYEDFIKAKLALKELKKKLKSEIAANSNLVIAADNIALISDKVKDLKDILSLHLARHYVDTDDTAVPVEGEPNVVQPIVITAKLGSKTTVNKRG